MKANELRIGNYYNHNGAISQVTPNTIEEVWEAQRTWCKPIPLTEEWLLNFGFTKELDYFFIQISPFGTTLYLDIEDNIYQIGCKYGGWYANNTEIKHVHQLQNLYFALTNEELKLRK